MSDALVVLGIDPGSRMLGYALVCSRAGVVGLERSGVLVFKKTDSLSKKLLYVFDFFKKIVLAYIDIGAKVSFAIERQYSDKNPQSAFVLVSFYSIFLLLSESLNVKCVGMLPTQVKKIISGDGLCNKDFLRMALERQFGILIDAFSHDETDAIAIALAALLDYKE